MKGVTLEPTGEVPEELSDAQVGPYLLAVCQSHREHTVPWLHGQGLLSQDWPCSLLNFNDGHTFDIGASRNKLVRGALEFKEVTHLLFIDDDLVLVDSTAIKHMFCLMERNNYSIMSGLYYKHQYPHSPLLVQMVEKDGSYYFVFPFEDRDPPKHACFEVSMVPAGCLLVRREVFEKIPEPWFVYRDPEVLRKTKNPDAVSPGEDVYFSLKAAKYGYKLYVDTTPDILHWVPRFVGRREAVERFEDETHDWEGQQAALKLSVQSLRNQGRV